jgi:hypothetical protein
MANSYIHFSEAISDLTAEEKLWCENHFAECAERAAKDEDFEFEDENVLFDYEFQEINGSPSLWMYTEECGSPGSVAEFVQKFFEKWRPDASMTIGWAATCSKPRLGEFGGGLIHVTATEIRACDGSCALPSSTDNAPSYVQAAIVICHDGNFLKEYGENTRWDDITQAIVFDDEWQAREVMKDHGQPGWQILANPLTAIESVLYEHE